MKFVYVIFSFLIFSVVSFADVIDTKWEGPSELYRDGSVFCSYDQSKNPEVLKDGNNGSISIKKRFGGLVSVKFKGGCSKILTGGLLFKVIDEKIVDASGNQVGIMTADKIEIENFNNFLNHVFVKSLIIENIENDQLNIELVFTHSSIGAELEFIALMQQTL